MTCDATPDGRQRGQNWIGQHWISLNAAIISAPQFAKTAAIHPFPLLCPGVTSSCALADNGSGESSL